MIDINNEKVNKKINNNFNENNNKNNISPYIIINKKDIKKDESANNNTWARDNNKVNIKLKKEGFIDEKWNNKVTGKIDKFLIIVDKNKDKDKIASDNKNIISDTNNKHNLKENVMDITDEKLVRKIDIDNNIIDLKKFYKVDMKNKGLINLMNKKDEQILEIEKLIEENYKINEITCGIDYSNNILKWNCRGVYSLYYFLLKSDC